MTMSTIVKHSKQFAVILALVAVALVSHGSEASAKSGAGIRGAGGVKVAPVAQAARQVSGQVSGQTAGRSKAKCKYVSDPYPHLDCSF
jgi:hypothetical protein